MKNVPLILYYIGCQVQIWEHRKRQGSTFICDGNDNEKWCHSNDLGSVGDDEASSITCTCPKSTT